jgi:hypothetical protein
LQLTEEAFMRLAAFIVLAVGAGASMWAQASTTGTERIASSPSAAELQSMRHALVAHLRASEGAITADLLLSPGDAPGEWHFRGRAAPPPDAAARGPGQPHPHGALYGRATLGCGPDGMPALPCWEISVLEIGGETLSRRAQVAPGG